MNLLLTSFLMHFVTLFMMMRLMFLMIATFMSFMFFVLVLTPGLLQNLLDLRKLHKFIYCLKRDPRLACNGLVIHHLVHIVGRHRPNDLFAFLIIPRLGILIKLLLVLLVELSKRSFLVHLGFLIFVLAGVSLDFLDYFLLMFMVFCDETGVGVDIAVGQILGFERF
jgi:hypothetical protein